MRKPVSAFVVFFACQVFFLSCKSDTKNGPAAVNALELKRGEVVSCGPQDGEMFGTVSFTASVPENLQKDFNIGIALLYSFEYDESEKMFAKVIDKAPECAMAYWGVAMSNFHPLWAPPTAAELKKGMQAIGIARSIKNKTQRESEYIEAVARFYENADQLDHLSRLVRFEKAMESVYKTYPDDLEASVFYALALNAAADPADKKYTNQRKAFDLLNPIFQKAPLHPGIAHYIIHNCDYPELAELALPAARKYAKIAPSSAHAQHMPSHIFTRLGYWDECIQSNLVAASSAQCYAEQVKLNGHWDEELHCLDYLVYSYLQKGDYSHAKQQLDYLQKINEVSPVTFKVAYAFAAIPARYALERKEWKEAAGLQLQMANVPWEKFPWQKAIFHFAKSMGYVHLNKIDSAQTELATLKSLYVALTKDKNTVLEAAQVAVQVKATEAWIEHKLGNAEKAIELMTSAADMEDATEKHPVTPCAVIPARELLGDMLLEMDKPALALRAFELDLKIHPNRLNGLQGLNAASQQAVKTAQATLLSKN
jgi:tetratricopeptide (TPR) repeat protein